jgi:hypothetical protein
MSLRLRPGNSAAAGHRRRTTVRSGLLGGTLGVTAVGASYSTPGPGQSSGPATDADCTLVVYYSRVGENYYYGDGVDLEVGTPRFSRASSAPT